MPDSKSLLLFVSTALVLLIVPGPVVFYIVARSLEQGRIAGLVSTLGVGLGTIVHVAVAALGLSAIVMRSALAFSVVKYLGAAYLIYLGVRTLLEPLEPRRVEDLAPRKLSSLFLHGFLVNLLNPKAALFFLAFLPQFVVPGHGSTLSQVLFLGGVFTTLAVLTDSTYAVAAGTVRRYLSTGQGIDRLRRNLSGVTYIALGLLTAVSGSGRKQ